MSGQMAVNPRDVVRCAFCPRFAHRPLVVRLNHTPNLCDECETALATPGDPAVAKQYRARVARRARKAKRAAVVQP